MNVSIIIPTHNRKALLCDAVESCLYQTPQHIEIIIVDDGSTDGTDEVVAELLKGKWSDSNVRYIWQENQGASAARNRGLLAARGEYIQFLDSDDILLPGKLEKQFKLLILPENKDLQMCYCVGLMGVSLECSRRIGILCHDIKQLVSLLLSRHVHVLSTPSPLWRRSHLMSIDGWMESLTVGDDLEYYLRLVVGLKKIACIDDELFWVSEHPGSRLSTERVNEKSLQSMFETQQCIQRTLLAAGMWNDDNRNQLAHTVRTLYANYLNSAAKSEIKLLEEWIVENFTGKGKAEIKLARLILAKKLIGRKLLMLGHDFIKKKSNVVI